MKKKLLSTSLILASVCFAAAIVAGQEKLRTLEERHVYENSPITIVGRTLLNSKFDTNNRIMAGPDWLKDARVVIKNVSERNITRITAAIRVWKQGKMPADIAMEIEFPSSSVDAGNTKNGSPRILRPGETTKVKISEKEVRYWGDQLALYEVTDVEKVTLNLVLVVFDDKTGWHKGIEVVQDPENEHNYIRKDLVSRPVERVFGPFCHL